MNGTSEIAVEDHDYYSYDDYADYGEYEEHDPCDELNTYYDGDNEETCRHAHFESKTPIQELEGFSNKSIYKPCCLPHGYLYRDECEVF